VLAHLIDNAERVISPDAVIKAVAEFYSVKVSDLRSDRKHKVVALPRQVAMYLIRSMTRCSLPDIGLRFGGRDHTTVMYAVKKIDKKVREDVSFRNTVDTLRKNLEG
jgi:chromosomal replication initiator protein